LEALKLREKNLGQSSPLIADVLKSLGVLYTNQNYKQDQKKAGKLMQRAVIKNIKKKKKKRKKKTKT